MKAIFSAIFSTLLINGTAAHAGNTSSSGLPNPYSVFCQKNLGTIIPTQDEIGNQDELCQFDKGLISVFGLFGNPKAKASEAFLTHPEVSWPCEANAPWCVPNPASYYCVKLGGSVSTTYKFWWVPEGERFKRLYQPISLCTFTDRSSIAAETLLDGPEIHTDLRHFLEFPMPL